MQESSRLQQTTDTAKNKLLGLLATGIVGTDPLDEEEQQMLRELTPEQRHEIFMAVGDDTYAHEG